MSASDWVTMAGSDMLRRLLLHRDNLDSVFADLFESVAANIRDLRDDDGRLLGRAALKTWMHSGSFNNDILNQASAVTAGSFRAFEQIEMVGILFGRPDREARTSARPIAFDVPAALAVWASEQANLVSGLTDDGRLLLHYTMLIRLLGGETHDLPIARSAEGDVSFVDIACSRELPDEILLYEEFWPADGLSLQELPENGLAVTGGRTKAMFERLTTKVGVFHRSFR